MPIILRTFQREDLNTIRDKFNYRALLALEMGLGKTVEACAVIKETKSYPAIIVCLKGLKRQWAEMAWELFGLQSRIIDKRTPSEVESLQSEQLIILNFDLLTEDWLSYLYHLPPKIVVIDEVQLIGNMNSKRSYRVRQLCKRVPKLLMLSGTPFMNEPWELFPSLQLLRPDKFDSSFAFAEQYCDMTRVFGKLVFSGGRHLDKLHKRLTETCMVRRTFAEVAKDLPPKTRQIVPLEIEDRADYLEAEEDIIAWLAKTDMAKAIRAARSQRYTKFTYLKHLVAQKKLKPMMNWLDTALAESEGKILFGTIHRDITGPLYEKYKDISAVIDGSKTEAQREAAKTLFRTTKDCRILFCQMAAGGVGLNLPEAEIVGIGELPYNPATCQQFEKRAHRLTTTHPVRVYYLVGLDTIEDTLCKIIDRKQKEADRVLDGVPTKEDSIQLFDELQAALIKLRKEHHGKQNAEQR